jgi:hypothetical protein
MGFEVFVQCYGKTEQSGLSRDRVRALFPVDKESDPGCWTVRYGPTDWCDLYVRTKGDRLNGFMVSRPCCDTRLWDALLTVLQLGDVVMFWPGSPPMIGSAEGATRLPEDMVRSLGKPVLISRAEQFIELLKQT